MTRREKEKPGEKSWRRRRRRLRRKRRRRRKKRRRGKRRLFPKIRSVTQKILS